ncbi:hypothetical protein DIPPA_24470 [Diplonema papillatum]|nr:hypothetical protein DIPPA_24470 [Diplonema papillatum]
MPPLRSIPSDDPRFETVREPEFDVDLVVRKGAGAYDAEVDLDLTSLQVWNGARGLCRLLRGGGRASELLSQARRVLEVGAGAGLSAIVAARCVAGRARAAGVVVVASDNNPVAVALMRRNFERQACSEWCQARLLDWGTRAPVGSGGDGEDEGFDLVLAADVVITSAVARSLAPFLARAVARGGVFLLVHELRFSVTVSTQVVDAVDEPFELFQSLLRENGWRCSVTRLTGPSDGLVCLEASPPAEEPVQSSTSAQV